MTGITSAELNVPVEINSRIHRNAAALHTVSTGSPQALGHNAKRPPLGGLLALNLYVRVNCSNL